MWSQSWSSSSFAFSIGYQTKTTKTSWIRQRWWRLDTRRAGSSRNTRVNPRASDPHGKEIRRLQESSDKLRESIGKPGGPGLESTSILIKSKGAGWRAEAVPNILFSRQDAFNKHTHGRWRLHECNDHQQFCKERNIDKIRVLVLITRKRTEYLHA